MVTEPKVVAGLVCETSINEFDSRRSHQLQATVDCPSTEAAALEIAYVWVSPLETLTRGRNLSEGHTTLSRSTNQDVIQWSEVLLGVKELMGRLKHRRRKW